jgi:hypothetical protein
MNPRFVEMLKYLAKCVLSSDNLVQKRVGRQIVHAKDVFEYFKAYVKLFKDGKIPEVKSMFQVILSLFYENVIS